MTTQAPETYAPRVHRRNVGDGSPARDFSSILRLAFPDADVSDYPYREIVGNVKLSYGTGSRGWDASVLNRVGLEIDVGETIRRAVKARKDGTISISDIRAKHAELEAIYAERSPAHQAEIEASQARINNLCVLEEEIDSHRWTARLGETGDQRIQLHLHRAGDDTYTLEFKDVTADKVRQLVSAYKASLV